MEFFPVVLSSILHLDTNCCSSGQRHSTLSKAGKALAMLFSVRSLLRPCQQSTRFVCQAILGGVFGKLRLEGGDAIFQDFFVHDVRSPLSKTVDKTS